MARWNFSYMGEGWSFSPLTREGPPYLRLPFEAEDVDAAARLAKEQYPILKRDQGAPFDWGDPATILITRDERDFEEQDEPNDIMTALRMMQPTVYDYQTLARQPSPLDMMGQF